MSCRPIAINLEVDPSSTEKIVIGLSCACNSADEATWKMSFELQKGSPLATVVKLTVEIDPVNHPQAEATANANGLDAAQQGQAKIAAITAQNPVATEAQKNGAAQRVISSRQMPATAPATA